MIEDILQLDFVLAFIVGTAFICSVLFMILETFRKRTLGHFIVFGAFAVCISLIVDNLMGLYAWINLGLTFSNFGASLFLVGMIAVNVSMLWNFFLTSGRKLVQ